MFYKEINHKDGTKRYPVYFLEENSNIDYKYWKDAEEGELCISDDGMICEVIRKRKYIKGSGAESYYIRTVCGSLFYSKNGSVEFNCRDRKSSYTIDGKPEFENVARSVWFRDLVMAYAQVMDEHKAIKMVFGDDISKSKRTKLRRTVRTERFKSMVREELAKLLSDKGVTEGTIIDNLNEAMDLAKDKGDISNLMRGIENFQDMLGMRDKQVVKSSAQLTAVSTKELLEEINKETKAIDAKIQVESNE